jgi:hypothetical protein
MEEHTASIFRVDDEVKKITSKNQQYCLLLAG